VEEYVDRLESIRMSAAIGIDRGDFAGEQLCVLVEARLPFDAFEQAASDLLRSIVELVYRQLGFRPGRVFIVEKGTIPYTANGKLQHALLKERFLAGELDESILYPKERTK
jgi:acyl-CoA synthetase (AMP-forming)/AMP-acid ligase II